MRFDNVRLLVEDVARSFRFYRDVLGLVAHEGSDTETVFASLGVDDHVDIGLYARGLQPGADHDPPQSDRAVIVIFVDDVDALITTIEARGAQIATRPHDQVWGRVAHLRDPDGNLIELVSRTR